MAQEDFINKFRPHTLDDVVGQEHVTKSLKQLANKGKLPHAFLFHGPPGIGKTTVARCLAELANCHPELGVIEVDGATYSQVEVVRELTAQVEHNALTVRQPNKMIIYDEAGSISKAAWQALLKSIEEPPPHAYWVFCTTEIDKVPRTIRTRCHEYALQPVSENTLHDLLRGAAEQEDIALPDGDKSLGLLAEAAEGSPRMALNLLSKCQYAGTRREIKETIAGTVAEDSRNVLDFCRWVANPGQKKWSAGLKLVAALQNENPEGVRRAVVNYLNKVLLNTKNTTTAAQLLAHLQAFEQPYSTNGVGDLLLSLGEICFKD